MSVLSLGAGLLACSQPSNAADYKAYFRSNQCNPNGAIFCAIGSHDNAKVAKFIAAGVDINALGPIGGYKEIHPELKSIDSDRPLCLASRNGNIEAVNMLLAKGAKVNMPCFESSAIGDAARYGQEEIVKVLIKHGANPNQTDGLNRSPLMDAIEGPDGTWQQGPNNRAKQRRILKLLLDAGADPTYAIPGIAGPRSQSVYYSAVAAEDKPMISIIRRSMAKWRKK